MPDTNGELLRMENITKVYPNGIMANKSVDFSISAGEIHGLVGENGAGKTTLMQILFGLNHPEEGRILLEGREINISNPHAAIAYGIGMVHQHFMLVPSLSVAENLVMGVEPRKGIRLNVSEAIKITQELSEKYNLKVDPSMAVRDLPVGIKQKVEILKALHRGARILILDEPTAVLTPQETDELFEELKLLKNQGNTIIFISHKLNEIKNLCDRVTIMRSGSNQGVFDVADVTEQDISRLMVGRDVVLKVKKGPANPKETVLEVKNLTVVNRFQQTRRRRYRFFPFVPVKSSESPEWRETVSGNWWRPLPAWADTLRGISPLPIPISRSSPSSRFGIWAHPMFPKTE